MNTPLKKSGHFLSKIFPLPSYLKMESGGLDIGENGIKYLSFKNKNGYKIPNLIIEKKISKDAIFDGNIIKREEILIVLREIRKELKNNFVHISIPEEKTYLFSFQTAFSNEEEIKNNIEFHLEENVPISGRDAIFDFIVIPQEKSSHINVLVSAVSKKDSLEYENLAIEAGYYPLSIQGNIQATNFAITGNIFGKILSLNFGENKTHISIVENGFTLFSSLVQIGSQEVIETLKKHLGVEESEAKRVLKDKKIFGSKDKMEDFFHIMNSAYSLKGEIEKVISYWEDKEKSENKIKDIILSGKGSGFAGFDDYISFISGKKVRIGNVWSRAFSFDNYVPKLNFFDSLDYGGVIGLALS